MSNDFPTPLSTSATHAMIEQITQALEGLEYGTVQITVHDAKITQIERVEKRRFPLQPNSEKRKPSNR